MLQCPFLCCAQVQCCCHSRTAQTQLWAGHCRAAFSFHPGQENLSCSERNSHKYRSAQRLFWRNRPVSRRTSIPLLGFGCSYNSCQERNWATVSLHMSNLSIFDTLQSLLLLVILMEENQAAIYP